MIIMIPFAWLQNILFTYCIKCVISVVLWIGCFLTWLTFLTRNKINPWIWMDSKLTYYLFFFGRHYSSMLLVLMSVEKCFVFYFPLKSKSICTVKTAKLATEIVGIIMAGYNLVYIFVLKASSSDLYPCIYIGDSGEDCGGCGFCTLFIWTIHIDVYD